ncbi:NAD+ synthase [Desulfovibrio inopinatus]|uniref:NAD+ synthase n=1 Tax=Desulfovibrio inopinatus TaxID=102109 RepID=UPI00040BB052|nr:NAD+ synthase [Desulfovibrio inopinatus]
MNIGILQLNVTAGDIVGNADKIAQAVVSAGEQGADICLTSELALTGYPPRDLLLYPEFLRQAQKHLEELAARLKDSVPVLVGTALPSPNGVRPAVNAAALLSGGKVCDTFVKMLLPNYDVFDEERYFMPAESPGSFTFGGKRIGVTICEDIWNDKDFWKDRTRYGNDPVDILCQHGVDMIVNLSASPFNLGKFETREAMIKACAVRHKVPVFYVNQTGGNDDLVFDGRSFAVSHDGELLIRAAAFEEDILIVESTVTAVPGQDSVRPLLEKPVEEAFAALVTGTRDYATKCGFKKAVLALSGGIDSALTAVVAAKALGPENVTVALMPSPHSSRGSVDDSKDLVQRLGITAMILPIGPLMEEFDSTLSDAFQGYSSDVTEENLQSRIRGVLMMALSNKYGAVLLTTGNKSELAVGYCTIYGDMSGALAVIADLPKTMVYAVSEYVNATMGELIPRSIIDKAPSAELRPGQVDQDSLPPYDILDEILHLRVEKRFSVEEIVAAGHDRATVERITHLVKIAEFKRRQAAPGIKVTDRAFGTGWRMPVACRVPI